MKRLPWPCEFPKLVPPRLMRAMRRESASRAVTWMNIFNRKVRRRQDPPHRQAAYGVLPATSSAGRAQPKLLPAVGAWARFVNATLQRREPGWPPLRVLTAGYIRTDRRTPQHWHRDVPASHPDLALSVFTPVSMRCPPDDPAGSRWRPEGGGDRRSRPMGGSNPADVFVMDSRAIHRGGGRARGPGPRYRTVAFAALVERDRPAPDYDRTTPV